MNSEGVRITYGNIAPEAKENFVPSASEKETFVDLSQLQKYNLRFENYANPCEWGSVLLDSSTTPFPYDPENQNMGLWSTQISKADGTFETPIVLTLTASGQYSSQGLTLTFDRQKTIFCNDLNIKWYRNDTLLDDKDFIPNSSKYFCHNKVENYDKVIITFNKLNTPYNRLKLQALDYGYGTAFLGAQLRSVNVIQELNPISAELSINTVDFVLDDDSGIDYSFQSKQPLTVSFNGQLRATTFVSRSQRQTKTTWKVESEDYIGQLTSLTFLGDVYTDKNAKELLESIFSQAKIPVEIASDFDDVTLTGYIPVVDCREAVRQICFAIGAVCSTADSDKVKIYKLNDEITQVIPLTRIMQGQSFEESERVTSVNLTAYKYIPIEETIEAYKASEGGVGDNIFVMFSEPLHDLSITNGEILKNTNNTLKSSANYAIIKANNTNCILTGKKYDVVTTIYTKNNPIVAASDLENVEEVTGATLVNSSNAETILEKFYNYAIKKNSIKLKILEGKTRKQKTGAIYGIGRFGKDRYNTVIPGEWEFDSIINIGDVITCETEYLGSMTGRINSQRYNCNGGTLVKDCEML